MNEYAWLITIIGSMLTGAEAFVIWQSIKMPRERTAQAIMRFGKFHTVIMSWKGHRLNNPHGSGFSVADAVIDPTSGETTTPAREPWDIVPVKNDDGYAPTWSENSNIYFYLWPFYTTYEYPFSYLKLKRKGDLKPNDVAVWSDPETNEVLVARTGITNYVDCQAEYPTITGDLFTENLAKVLVFTNNTIRAKNPYNMLFKINNWFGVTTETIGAALKGVVSKVGIHQLNQIRSESADDTTNGADSTKKGRGNPAHFTKQMLWINYGRPDSQGDGICELFGAELIKCVFKAFQPGDEKARELLDSYREPKIAEQRGDATIMTAKKSADAKIAEAEGTATAYAKTQKAVIAWRKKFLVDTGLARVDAKGNITELVPDANNRISMDALKELSKLRGTLVLGNGNLQTMLEVGKNASQKEETMPKGEEKP